MVGKSNLNSTSNGFFRHLQASKPWPLVSRESAYYLERKASYADWPAQTCFSVVIKWPAHLATKSWVESELASYNAVA